MRLGVVCLSLPNSNSAAMATPEITIAVAVTPPFGPPNIVMDITAKHMNTAMACNRHASHRFSPTPLIDTIFPISNDNSSTKSDPYLVLSSSSTLLWINRANRPALMQIIHNDRIKPMIVALIWLSFFVLAKSIPPLHYFYA